MQPRGQSDTGVDAGRRATPGRPGRLRVRSLAARSLAAVLLAAFVALLALPQQAQTATEVWSASITTGTLSSLVGVWPDRSPAVGSITDQDFEYEGTTYTFSHIQVNTTGQLQIHMTTAFSQNAIDNLEFQVGSSSFALSDGTTSNSNATVSWNSSGLSWSSGQTFAVKMVAASTDATLSDLELSEGRLEPSFASGTTSYTAAVGYTVTRITVVPTTTDANATVAYLDGSDMPLPDANTVTDQQDVDLVVSETVVKVKVTAEDTSTLLTYTVTITRTAEDTSLSPPASDPVAANPSTAVYGVTFQGTWTRSVTPDGVPGGAHFSRLIGGVHSDAVTFLESGGTASAGVESMAEVGGWTGLQGEVQNAGSGALSVLAGDTDSISPTTSKTLTATLTTEHPRITLVTMVAPSPDWFVGVSGLPLLDDQGRWLRAHEVHLYPWDAGTEDGSEFSLNNLATSPQGVITSIRGTGKFSTEPIATLSFTLESVSTIRSVDENTEAGVNIGEPVVATDSSGAVTYSLGGTDAASFEIVSATGQLQTKAALDYETKSSYEVTVTETDSEGSAIIVVTIDVANSIEVSIEPGPSPVTEGGDVTFTLTRDAPFTDEFTINVSVEETGSMLTGALPVSATFAAGAETTSLTLTTEDDTPIEDPSTVTAMIEVGAGYQVTADAAAADVVVLDDLPRFVLRVGPAEVTEGGGGAVTVEITNGVTFTTAQTISLALGGTATADDFTLLNTSGGTLSAPYTLTIPANERVVAAYITIVNDTLPEPAETLTITASHDDTDIATETMTLRASPLRLELSSLTASGAGRAMYPSFDAGTLHYAVGCDPSQTLTLRLSTKDAATRLAVNGIQQANQNAVVELNELDGDDDILITLSNAGGANTTYVVHCMNSDDPYIDVVKQPGSSIELIAGSVNAVDQKLSVAGHLLVIDANGVPRFHRRIDSPRVNHFRPQDNLQFPYSVALVLPEPFHSPWGTRRDFEIAILDRDFNEVRRVTTTSAIPQTDQHDFLIKENGNFIFMAYAPFEHDLSEFVDRYGNPYGTMELAEDSLIEEVTPEGERVFFWSTYDHLYLGDCGRSQFPANYAHLNSLQLVDGGDLVISLRNCSQVMRIDGTSGEVQWRLGESNRSDAEWERLGLQPPLQIIGDPYLDFCGQHSAKLMPNGHLLLYDNGWQCRPDPETGRRRRPDGKFSRVVEYALDPDRGTATFVRHHSLHNSFSFFNAIQGVVVRMVNDSWLISWGLGTVQTDSPPDTTTTEYNLMTEQELLSLTIRRGSSGPLLETRAYPLGFDVLDQQAEPLAAALPLSAHTSVFTFGQTDTPTVVVAFSEPVVDLAADTPSVSVTGATIASLAPLIAAGEPANAYLFTLTPDGDGPITLTLLANQDCAAGGICTADGAMLSVVPEAYTIETPVSVSFTETSFTAMEGASASVAVSLSEARVWPFGITIPIVVADGGTASADEYTAPESVVFSSGDARQTASVPISDDALIEGDETIALAFGDLPTGVTLGTNSTTTVTITDTDTASFDFAVDDDEVGEGATVALTLTLNGDAAFAADQTIDLSFLGGGATAGVDFTVADSGGQPLTAPYALTLPAGSSSVVATLGIVDDAAEEADEAIVVSAWHGATSLGTRVITILANDEPIVGNTAPVFTDGRTAARSIAENSRPNRAIGIPLTATDIDSGDTLSYSLDGPDDGFFTVVPTSGQLRTRSGVTYDHEARSRYQVAVSVSDDEDTASIDVTVDVTDVDEPPDAPQAPAVTAAAASPSTSLEVTWMAPPTPSRPAVEDYDLRYKLVSEATFTGGPRDVSGTSATIS